MQNFGRFAVQSYLTTGINITTGVGYEFIRIINNSPYFLSLNFVGQGQIDFPECYLEDIPIASTYRGQLIIGFTANLSNIAQAPSFLLSVNGYNPGEISSPQAQPLTFVSNVGNTVSTNLLSNVLSNEVSTTGSEIIDVGTPTNPRLIDIFNSHFVWSVEQAGVAHQVMQGRTAGKPLLLGQPGDHTEVAGTLDIDTNLFVVNTTALDSGGISTDGNGNLTAVSVNNANGKILGIHTLITPYEFINNATYNNATTHTITIAGNGSIPSNATHVFVSVYAVGSATGLYLQMGPQGFSTTNPDNYPLMFQSQVANGDCAGNGMVPLNTSNGQVDIFVAGNVGNSFSSIHASVYAYVA